MAGRFHLHSFRTTTAQLLAKSKRPVDAERSSPHAATAPRASYDMKPIPPKGSPLARPPSCGPLPANNGLTLPMVPLRSGAVGRSLLPYACKATTPSPFQNSSASRLDRPADKAECGDKRLLETDAPRRDTAGLLPDVCFSHWTASIGGIRNFAKSNIELSSAAESPARSEPPAMTLTRIKDAL
jgi:hypothetical protein